MSTILSFIPLLVIIAIMVLIVRKISNKSLGTNSSEQPVRLFFQYGMALTLLLIRSILTYWMRVLLKRKRINYWAIRIRLQIFLRCQLPKRLNGFSCLICRVSWSMILVLKLCSKSNFLLQLFQMGPTLFKLKPKRQALIRSCSFIIKQV